MRTLISVALVALSVATTALAQQPKVPQAGVAMWMQGGFIGIRGTMPIFDMTPTAALAVLNHQLAGLSVIKEDISQAWWPPTICDRPEAREVCSFSGTTATPRITHWVFPKQETAVAEPK